MSTIDTRREQMFPKLELREIDRLRRFADVRRYSAGETLFVTGEIAPGMVVLIKGSVRVTRRDPLGHHAPIAEQGAGEFVAEVGQLSGQPAFVDVHAIDDVEALLIPSEKLRTLVIEEPELGERIMRALILRRVALVEAGAGGPVLIGAESTPDVIRLQGFLARNAYPHQLLDPTQDRDAAELVKQYAPNPADLPLAVCPKGSILKNPSETELARALRMGPGGQRDRAHHLAAGGRGARRGTRRTFDRGLRRIRGSLGDRLRRPRLWWTSWSERPYRELSRFSNRHFWPGAHWACVCPGAEIRCQNDDTHRSGAPRPERNSDRASLERRRAREGLDGGRGDRRSLPAPRRPEPRRLRGARSLVLGFAHRSAPMSKRGDRSGRGWQLCGTSRCLPAQLRCKNLDAGARDKSRRKHVTISH